MRLVAVDAVLSQYGDILVTLEELETSASDLSARAAGLRAQLSKGSTLVALRMARAVLAPLDRLCRVVQSSACTVFALMESVRTTQELLRAQRTSADDAIKDFLRVAEQSSCEEVELPRKRRKPARYREGTEDQPPGSVEEYFRNEFLMILDAACDRLEDRFNQEGTKQHEQMERLLLSAPDVTMVRQLLKNSPWAADLSPDDLAPQLQVLYRNRKPKNLADAADMAASMEPAARLMVPDAIKLLRLLLTLPATSATSERSFSALRRLKTWLRSTMTQLRLNAMAICHVHRERVAQVDTDRVASTFIQLNTRRERVFGSL